MLCPFTRVIPCAGSPGTSPKRFGLVALRSRVAIDVPAWRFLAFRRAGGGVGELKALGGDALRLLDRRSQVSEGSASSEDGSRAHPFRERLALREQPLPDGPAPSSWVCVPKSPDFQPRLASPDVGFTLCLRNYGVTAVVLADAVRRPMVLRVRSKSGAGCVSRSCRSPGHFPPRDAPAPPRVRVL